LLRQPRFIDYSVLLTVGLVLCVLAAIVFAALSQKGKLRISKHVFTVIIVLGMLQIAGLALLQRADAAAARRALASVNLLAVSNLVIRCGSRVVSLANTNDFVPLLSIVQRARPLPAHHSHPARTYELSFSEKGRFHRYRLGQDSQNPAEYWVFDLPDDGSENPPIGRIQSPQLGSILDHILDENPEIRVESQRP
jgi:hypothetical protein